MLNRLNQFFVVLLLLVQSVCFHLNVCFFFTTAFFLRYNIISNNLTRNYLLPWVILQQQALRTRSCVLRIIQNKQKQL